MHFKRKLLLLALACGACLVGHAATYHATYDVTVNNFPQPITNLMFWELGDNGYGSATWAFSLAPSQLGTIVNPFVEPPINMALAIGLVQDLPGDAAGQQHLVFFMSDAAASAANHIAWGTFFRTGPLEEDVIANLELATSGQDFSIIQPGLDYLDNFLHNDFRTGITIGGVTPVDTWFNMGDSFTLFAFSDGQILGSGQSSLSLVAADAPEPATLACAGLGLLAIGLIRRETARRTV